MGAGKIPDAEGRTVTDRPGRRVLSGMRPTGPLHLGHYYGVLKSWRELQERHECFFFVADWHALTTEYEKPTELAEYSRRMVVDWLAAGIDPSNCRIFLQSWVPEHAELQLLLAMLTPLSWLERVPSYKDQLQMANKDLLTHGFLGYPLLQAADILIYKAAVVPVGEDQAAHVELAREIARRFNHLYGGESGFEGKAKRAAEKLGKRDYRLYFDLRRRFQEKGDSEALERARELVRLRKNITIGNRERLLGYLEGGRRAILAEPEALLTGSARLPGLDGRKMSKSLDNSISLREDPAVLERKLLTMATDPARVRRSDPGDPDKCPVWPLHQACSEEATRTWVLEGCRSAAIGCVDCKRRLLDTLNPELQSIRERALRYEEEPDVVDQVLKEGTAAARETARKTMQEVRTVMGLRRR